MIFFHFDIRPPGGGSEPYSGSCVTRSYIKQFYSYKIPLSLVSLPSASITNNAAQFPNNSML